MALHKDHCAARCVVYSTLTRPPCALLLQAMTGRQCVAVAVDRRFGIGNQMVSKDARRVLKLHSRLLCAFTGLTADVQTLMQVSVLLTSALQVL